MLPSPQVAAYLGVSESKLRTMAIPRKVLDGKRLYDRLDLDAYADALSVEGESMGGNTCDGKFGARR
nr:helix-turn-helix domain-containing protein [Rubellimicrobium arenae]